MKILFCNYEYPPLGGGGGVITASLAEELAKRHNVVVLTSQALGLPSESIESGVRIVRVPVFFRRRRESANFPSMLAYLPLGVLGVRKLRRKENFDIVNTHFVLPTGPVGQVAARMWGIPNVLSVHEETFMILVSDHPLIGTGFCGTLLNTSYLRLIR